ncbi:hypothetical protein Tco_0793598 [Tanacetum coccineum]
MAVLESCPKHNMVAYLEKTDGNAEFHEIIDFLTRSSIHYALTVSLVISTTFVEQFWTSAKSQTINNVRYINAKVAGKPVTISEASIRSDLRFNDVDGIDSLNNQAIFDAIKLMGKAYVEPQSDPSPRLSPTIPIPDPILEGSGGNLGSQSSSDKSLSGSEGVLTLQSIYDLNLSLCTYVTAQAAKIKSFKAQVKKLKKQAKPFILHHKAWLRTIKRKNQNKKKVLKTLKRMSALKQRRKTVKSSKGAPIVPTNTEWDDLDMDIDDTMDYTLAQDEGKNDKVNEKGESTAQQQSTDRQDEGTDMPKVSTARTKLSTDKVEEDDETISQVLLNMSQAKAVSKEKEKGVEIRTAKNAKRRRTTSTRSVLTLKPLPKIDPNDKGKKRIEEDEKSDTESKEITKDKKKFDQIDHDEEYYDASKKRLKKDDILRRNLKKKNELRTKVPAKVDVTEQGTKKRKGGHMKMIARKRKRPQPDVDSDDEHRKCLKIVTFEGTIDSEIMERKSVIARLNKVSSPDGDYLVIYRANGNFRAFNYLLEVLHIFDRQDLFHLYDLVMKQYSEVTLEGIELILWGDLKIMMESSTEENDQKLEDGTVIHMLVERRYPLSKDLLQRMLDLGLEVEEESTAALHLGSQLTLLQVCVNLFISATTLNKVEDLYSKGSTKKYGLNRPEEIYDRVLWGDLKTMFDPPLSDDAIWSLPLQQKMINWRYYPSCVVHCLTLDDTTIYMLADRKYPLSKDACQVMLKMKLLDGTTDEVCYQLLKMIEKQAGLR